MTTNKATVRGLGAGPPGLGLEPPPFHERPTMHHTWASLSFLHWPYDPEALQPLLPPGLVADTIAGSGYIGLILFHLTARPAWPPAVPWLCSFAETNVRTYVRDSADRPGILFLSLDAARLGAVAVARASPWRLPYHWAAMQVRRDGDLVAYACRRRWPGCADGVLPLRAPRAGWRRCSQPRVGPGRCALPARGTHDAGPLPHQPMVLLHLLTQRPCPDRRPPSSLAACSGNGPAGRWSPGGRPRAP